MLNLGGRDLRDIVVLTIQTTEVATCTGEGKTRRTWMEMIERFLFYRIDGERTGQALHIAIEHTIAIAPAATNAPLAISNMAMVGTKLALNCPTLQLTIIPAFHQNTIAS